MIYAQILNNIVQNIITLDDEDKADIFLTGYHHCVRIDNLVPHPSIGWFYDGKQFCKAHNLKFIDTLPDGIPNGTAVTFDTFKVTEGNYDFTVSVKDSIITIGCHDYDYKWLRHALWKIIEQDSESVGPLKKNGKGVSYENQFHFSPNDVNLIYSAVCKLL